MESLYIDKLNTDLSEETKLILEYSKNNYTLTFKQFLDEMTVGAGAPANNAGTPGIDGFTPDTVGVSKRAQRKHIRKKNIFRRS